jgi:hypothetical protein
MANTDYTRLKTQDIREAAWSTQDYARLKTCRVSAYAAGLTQAKLV